jgi:hypothetical protein
MGQMEMKCIFDIGKKNSILAKVTQVSDVAHGPLVLLILIIFRCFHVDFEGFSNKNLDRIT